jgi:diguanylate cyclase (GGDEF)-like protein
MPQFANSSFAAAAAHAPDNRYQQSLRSGFPRLRFDDALEREYRKFNYAAFASTRRTGIAILLTVLLCFLAYDLHYAGVAFIPSVTLTVLAARVLGLAVAVVASVQLLKHPTDPDVGDRWIPAGLLAVGLTTIVIMLAYMQALDELRMPFTLDGLVMIQMAVFFPLGYSYWRVMSMATVLTLAVWAGVPWLAPASLLSLYVSLMPFQLGIYAAASVSRYCLEHAIRSRFLMERTVELMASTDELTHLHNRRMFDVHGQRALQHASREGRRAAMVLLDIDYFKQYNDRYGHPAGDQVIAAIGALVSQRLRREIDIGARLGGDELAIMFYDVDEAFVETTINALCGNVVLSLARPHADSPFGTVTVSMGAAMSVPGERLDGLYQRADTALYAAKAKGRNRACLLPQGQQAAANG